MKTVYTAIFFVAIAAVGALPAWAQMSPVGLWRTLDDKTQQPTAEVRIRANTAGVLSGVVERSVGPDDGKEANCSQCTDERKDQPKIGMEIIRGAQKAEGKDVWEGGKILDPDNGKSYTLRLTPIDGGKKLEVRGSIGPFGRTQTWIRVQ